MTSWLAEHWLAAALMGLYTAALVVNAHAGLRASRSISGYYVGDRNMSGPLIGLSFFATFASTNSYIGHAGKGYEYGLAWMTIKVSPLKSIKWAKITFFIMSKTSRF